jgi:hypothetical protein
VISKWQFEPALRNLLALDMQELVDAGVIADRDYAGWDDFHADPVEWFMKHPAMTNDLWRAIVRHRPSSQVAEPPQTQDNIIDLRKLRDAKG